MVDKEKVLSKLLKLHSMLYKAGDPKLECRADEPHIVYVNCNTVSLWCSWMRHYSPPTWNKISMTLPRIMKLANVAYKKLKENKL